MATRKEPEQMFDYGGEKMFALFVVSMLTISGVLIWLDDDSTDEIDDFFGIEERIEWGEPVFMPRDEECIDETNGQTYPEYGIGYEPSLSLDSDGNMFVTAHKDLRWGGEDSPIPIFLDPDDPGLWYACEEGEITSWDYWASWFWKTNDGGLTWDHGDNFDPTPGNMLMANYAAGGSECLGDEGDISVDANDIIYYLDTTLEDNWWHKFTDGGNVYESSVCQRMNSMAADDRPWVAAQGDGIIHYLGNSGVSITGCSGQTGRYWYYHSENGGDTFSQCYPMPGGWGTIASQRNGTYVYAAQESNDDDTGNIHIRISDDYGRGTGFGPSDGTWQEPLIIGDKKGNPPEGYPVVNTNEQGTVSVVWADCPDGRVGAWEMNIAISYDYGVNWSTWEITPEWEGITMYPFVSISEEDRVAVSFYGLDYATGNSTVYTEGTPWYLYSGYLDKPQLNDSWEFEIADPTPLHTVTAYEVDTNDNGILCHEDPDDVCDVHALHDFFETVISPDGSWMGIAYQRNVDQHPFEENEEQRYIMFVRGELN